MTVAASLETTGARGSWGEEGVVSQGFCLGNAVLQTDVQDSLRCRHTERPAFEDWAEEIHQIDRKW